MQESDLCHSPGALGPFPLFTEWLGIGHVSIPDRPWKERFPTVTFLPICEGHFQNVHIHDTAFNCTPGLERAVF
jgi:hypothetical protein